MKAWSKRIISFLLAFVLLIGAVPVDVAASEMEPTVIPEETTAPTLETTEPTEETTAPTEETTAPTEEPTVPAVVTIIPTEEVQQSAALAEQPAPLAETTSGQCGDNATWTMNMSTGTLTIDGTGAMYDYVIDYPGWNDVRESVTSVVINSGITHIGESAFALCTELLSITIPSSVESIGSAAFQYCSKLANVYISDLKAWLEMNIADQKADPLGAHPQKKSLYLNNSLVTDLVIPEGCAHIRDRAFYRCISLNRVSVAEGVTSIGKSVFEGCESITAVSLPDTLTGIGDNAFYLCKSLTAMELPEGVTVIAANTFGYCDNLATLTTGANVTSIGESAFYECGSLSNFTIPGTVVTIGNHAFHGCKKLTEVVIPEGVTEIGQSTFHSCYGLSEITIPSRVTSIGRYAFYWCSNLKSITLPGSLVAVGENAFDWCDKLSNVYYHGTEERKETITFGEGNYRLTAAQWNYLPCAHIFGNWTYTTAPTCKDGGAESRTCTLCGETETREVEALGHTFGNWEEAAAPTCTEDGVEIGTCSGCGATSSRRKPATGHSCNQWTMTKFPTCTEEGEQTGVCQVCSNDARRSVPALGHEYTAVVTAPTCTEGGYTTYTCHCSDTYIADEVAAAGHSWGEWTVTLEPVGYEAGEETRMCITCKQTETRPVEPRELAAPEVKISADAASGKPMLKWNAVAGATKYQVYRATSKNGKYTLMKTVTDTSYINNSAKTNTQYHYKVRSVGAADKVSKYSSIVSCRCDLPRPGITVSGVSSTGKIKVSWKAITGAKSYQVWRATSENGEYTLMKTTTSTSYTNTSAKAGQTYYYKVRAIHSNTNANSAYSLVKSRTCDLARPTVTLSSVASTGKIKVGWKAITGAVSYDIYRATGKGGTYSLVNNVAGTSFTDNETVAGKTYYYQVVAVHSNTSANSAKSTAVSRVCDLARPDVTISLSGKGKPMLTWEGIEGATKYEVYRATSKTGKYTLVKTTTNTSFTNTGAKKGTTYFFKVKAIHSNTNANSAYSQVDSIRSK